jgi:D-glycero-alpha-D-manno-heptose 1-phosphate guanylyltransferase
MKAIVLCGGLGTRLGQLTRHTPKPMLQVAGRPFIGHVLDRLCVSGIDGIVLAAGFAWDQLKSFIGNSWLDIPIQYSVEPNPLGTGGAILLAMQRYKLAEALVINGDTLFDIDLSLFIKNSRAHTGVSISTFMALKTVDNCSRYGRVEIDQVGLVKSFGEKEFDGAGLINGGIYIQQREDLEKFVNVPFSFEKDYLTHDYKYSKIIGIPSIGYFIDIGTPADLSRADLELSSISRR